MAKDSPSTASMASILRAYSAPILIFIIAMLYQLIVLPRSFPSSHYDVLDIKRYSSIDTVREAYSSISSQWDSGSEIPSTPDFIKTRYAYELLTNPVWKRDYDIYGIDEQFHIIDRLESQYAGESFSQIKLPLLVPVSYDAEDESFNIITSQTFGSMFQDSKPWLIQVYSSGSNRSSQFSSSWKRIVGLLDGVANHGMVELGEAQLAVHLAEKKPTGQVFFRYGIPAVVAFPPQCRSPHCIVRYEGELSVDAVTDWFASSIMSLPRILYYSKETLVPKFLAKIGSHKVKVILFSKTGERATPFVRQAAKSYWNFASFACVLWREEDASFWWNGLEVESAPAIVIVKDPGLKPIVYHGSGNQTWFLDIMEQNKQPKLPQLRSQNSMELGCDARGYSRAGYDTVTWYCAILAGRQSMELNKMRETMYKVQDTLLDHDKLDGAAKDEFAVPAATALKNKRLTFTWLDGETQSKYCSFYVHHETSYDTCGPRRTPSDVPQLLIVRYQRNSSEESEKLEKETKGSWAKSVLQSNLNDLDPSAQLVVSYNGPAEIPEIIKWLSKMVEDGDSNKLPFYRARTPELVPEGVEPISSGDSRSHQLKQTVRSVKNTIHDYLSDPRIGPALLLGALLCTGSIWLMRSQPKKPEEPSPSNQSDTKEETSKKKRRERARNVEEKDVPASITDDEPKDAYQLMSSGSDSD